MTMVSSRYAHAFPKTAAQEMLLGSLCHESRNLTHLRFSLWEARKPQVHLFYDPPPCEAGPDAAPDSIEAPSLHLHARFLSPPAAPFHTGTP